MYHQVVFGLLVITTALRTQLILRRSEASGQIPPQIRSVITKLFFSGHVLFLLGFIIWNLDTIYCTALTRRKVAIGWPLAFLLEGLLDCLWLRILAYSFTQDTHGGIY